MEPYGLGVVENVRTALSLLLDGEVHTTLLSKVPVEQVGAVGSVISGGKVI